MPVQPYTAAKKAANERWNKKNKERVRYIAERSKARSFIKKYATDDDLHELLDLITSKLAERPVSDA
ncbi:hypothetical protein [Levilactobacillus enshiensis]|uniref:hypothetical protein n=1 Tax=Levilactobacillus enshiensis TaxID=2590213 RepID=UPI001179B734|nr:hypothetical protein [Levilactobacillus enshiensis]